MTTHSCRSRPCLGDPGQMRPVQDEAATERLVALMLDEMGAHAAPPEIYARLALAP